MHTVGGMASLIATYFCGPRIGRFGMDGEVNRDFRETNGNLVVLGTFLLWFGWYGFNPGSALVIAGETSAATVGRTAVVTTLAAGTGGVAAMVLSYAVYRWVGVNYCSSLSVNYCSSQWMSVAAEAHYMLPGGRLDYATPAKPPSRSDSVQV